jgi:hypothetical protein
MTAAELAQAWANIERAVEASAMMPPGALDASVWDTVAEGKVAHEQSDRGVRGVGVIADSLPAVWLAITDDAPVDAVAELTQVAWAGAWASPKFLYQRLDLPWPFQDRHWVAQSHNNAKLAATGVWERWWDNAPTLLADARGRTDAAAFDAAIAVPENRGNWLLYALAPEQTLAIYQARVNLGGQLPTGAADQYAAVKLPKFYASVQSDARSMHHRYVRDCTQPGADGATLPCFGD